MHMLKRTIICILVLVFIAVTISAHTEAQGPLKASEANLNRLFQEGAQAYQRADYRGASKTWQAALAQARSLKNIPYTSQLLMNLGAVHWALGEYKNALSFLEEGAELFRASGNRQGEAMILNNMGMVHQNLGQYERALPLYERSLAIKQALGDRKSEANSLANIGNIYVYLGRYEQALLKFEQALTIVRDIGDKQVENLALSGLGWGYFNQGKYRQALEFYEQALEIARRIGDRNGMSVALTGVSISYTEMGRYDDALESHKQALAMKRSNGDRQGEGTSLNNIGVVYQKLRQYDLARGFYEDALAIKREIGDRQGEGQTLLNIATVHDELGQYEQALEYHQQALGMFQDIGERQGEGKALSNLGATYSKLDQYDAALDYYQQSLALRRDIGDLQGQSIDQINIAMIRQIREQYEQAAQELRNSLKLCSDIGALQYLWMAQAGLALVESKQKNYEEAVTLYEQALESIESLRAGISEGGFRSSFLEDKLFVYDEFITLLHTLHQQHPDKGYDRKSFEIFERKQGRVFLEEMGKSGVRSFSGISEKLLRQERELENRLARLHQQISERYSASLTASEQERMKELQQQQETLKAKRQTLEAAIEKENPEYYALKYPKPVGLSELQQSVLQAGELLLVYNVMKEQTLLWLIAPDTMQSYNLPAGEDFFQEKVAGLRESMQNEWSTARGLALPEHPLPQASETEGPPFPERSHELYQMLIPETLRPMLASTQEGAQTQRLTVIPTGPLYALPFELLLTKPVGTVEQGHYLIEDIPINYLSSTSLLKTLREIQEGRSFSAGFPFLAFANPVYENSPPSPLSYEERGSTKEEGDTTASLSLSKRGGQGGSLPERTHEDFQSLRAQAYRDLVSNLFAELPETEDEARAVAEALNVPEEEEDDVLHVRENASRAKVFELQKSGELAEYRYLLFAMHGVLPEEVEHVTQSALVLSDDFLTMADVFGLRLNAGLVSLSACNTGMGARIRGEGVMGLTRAFMYAGTPAVAVTLWSVESLSAKELDVGFFQQLHKGKSPAEALQAVKIQMLQGEYDEAYRSPYYWAPFVIFGDGR